MLRYVASLPGNMPLFPTDPLGQLKVNEAIGLAGDFEREWSPCLYMAMVSIIFLQYYYIKLPTYSLVHQLLGSREIWL